MKNILKIYKMMFHYWGYFLAGIFFMFAFAFLSGASITMVIPLFDYVFAPRKIEAIYLSFSSFYHALHEILTTFFSRADSIFSAFTEVNRTPLIVSLQNLLSKTDPWLLLTIICVAMLALVLFKNVFYYGNVLMFANLRGKTVFQIRNNIFRKYLNQSLRFFNFNKVGDSLVRMVSDVNIVSDMFIGQAFNLVRDAVLLLIYAGIAISLNTRLFFLSLVILPVSTLFINFLGKKIKKYAIRIQNKFSDMFSKIEEVLNSMKIVKAFSRETYELGKFKEINHKYFIYWRKSVVYSLINTPFSELNGTITGIIVILIGGKLVLSPDGSFSTGKFLAFLFAIFSMLHPMKTLTQAYADIKRALVSVDRVFYILNQESEVVDCNNPIHKEAFNDSIELKNVSFSYNNTIEVLKNISLKINKGEKIAFVGSSGSGKTTFVNLLPRLYDVTSGEILIDGINIKQIFLKELRKMFGIVTQESILFSDTVANNIRYGTLLENVPDNSIKKAAQIAYADEFIEKLPAKYNEMLHTKAANLSGGQKQRLCIARAIINDPPILIFDEATSSLDTESERFVQQAIDRATANRTVIVIAHRLSTIISADTIVVLDKGKIVGIGKHHELLKKCKRYQVLYNLQFKTT